MIFAKARTAAIERILAVRLMLDDGKMIGVADLVRR
jgi:hypothetical protein